VILVIAEQRDGTLNRATWETIAAAQQAGGGPVSVALPGSGLLAIASELAAAAVQEVVTIESPALATYTPDGYTAALAEAIGQLSPTIVALPHTYQTRDFAPKLAARLDRALVTDVVAIKTAEKSPMFVRPMFQGKLTADVVPLGPGPHFVTFQLGAFRADQAARGKSPAPVRALAVTVDAAAIRQRPEPPFREARQAVDLSQAERIVSVGRGIKEQSNLALAQALAAGGGGGRGPPPPPPPPPKSPPRARSATRGGCRWIVRWAARGRRSRRSCTSRWAFPGRSSTSSG